MCGGDAGFTAAAHPHAPALSRPDANSIRVSREYLYPFRGVLERPLWRTTGLRGRFTSARGGRCAGG